MESLTAVSVMCTVWPLCEGMARHTHTTPLLRERCKHFFGEGTVRVQHDFKVLVGGTCRRLPGPAVYSTWVQADEMLSSPYVRPWRLVVVWGKTPSLPPSPHADNNTPDDLPDSLPLSSHRRGIMIDLGSKTNNPSEF